MRRASGSVYSRCRRPHRRPPPGLPPPPARCAKREGPVALPNNEAVSGCHLEASPAATTANRVVNTFVGARGPSASPITAPSIRAGSQDRTRSGSIVPARQWAPAAVTEATRMLAWAVPTASGTASGSAMPFRVNTSRRTGTATIPPPTPSNPREQPDKDASGQQHGPGGWRVGRKQRFHVFVFPVGRCCVYSGVRANSWPM